ncbi:MAG: hypothetical protein ABIS92_05130 [Polyangia bacterium]
MAVSGTCTIAGTAVTATSAGGMQSTSPYCVAGNLIHPVQLDATINTGPMGQETIITDIAGEKQ